GPARELGAADVLVVARLGLRGRREDRLGELLRLDERLWKLLARDRAERFVFGPGGTGDVAAGDALDVDALAVLHEHRPPGERTRIAKRLWKAAGVGRGGWPSGARARPTRGRARPRERGGGTRRDAGGCAVRQA